MASVPGGDNVSDSGGWSDQVQLRVRVVRGQIVPEGEQSACGEGWWGDAPRGRAGAVGETWAEHRGPGG